MLQTCEVDPAQSILTPFNEDHCNITPFTFKIGRPNLTNTHNHLNPTAICAILT